MTMSEKFVSLTCDTRGLGDFGDPGLGSPCSGAEFSLCRSYRTALWRRWGSGDDVNFLMLNPSIADAYRLDPTVRRCVGYAKKWGFGGIVVTNLFSLVSADPHELKRRQHPVSPEADPGCNDRAILHAAQRSGLVVAAWGTHGAHLHRGEAVQKLLVDAGIKLHVLHLTTAGHPGHPLCLRADLRPQEWAT